MGRAAVDALRKALADKQADVDAQGEVVRALAAGGAPGPQIDAAVGDLNDLKIDEAVIERQLRVAVSGAGLYDYGPSGGDLRSNVLAFWRQMWDVECPYTPPAILCKAAGLVDDPTVLMVKDEETGLSALVSSSPSAQRFLSREAPKGS